MCQQVNTEYSILQDLHPDIPLPEPIYCSTSHDERIVRTEFIVLEFIQVCLNNRYTYMQCTHVLFFLKGPGMQYWFQWLLVVTGEVYQLLYIKYYHTSVCTEWSTEHWSPQKRIWKSNYTSFLGDRIIQEAYSQSYREAGSQGDAAQVWLTHITHTQA